MHVVAEFEISRNEEIVLQELEDSGIHEKQITVVDMEEQDQKKEVKD